MTCRDSDSFLAQIVIRHTEAQLDGLNIKRDSFVKNMLLPSLIRSGVLNDRPDAKSKSYFENSLCKKFERWIKGEYGSVPADYIFPWIAILQDGYKTKCLHEVCGAMGSFFAPLSPIGPKPLIVEMQSQLANVSKEFADVLQHAAPALDGRYNQDDDPQVMHQLSNELFELITAAFTELGAIYQASGILPSAYRAMYSNPIFQEPQR